MQVQRQNLNARLPILEKTAAAAEQSGKKDARKRHGALNLILETGHFKTMRPKRTGFLFQIPRTGGLSGSSSS